MPVDFTLPPDTRAVGTGNPPQDIDNIVDALTALGAGQTVLNASYAGGADPTGVNDSYAAFAAAVSSGVGVVRVPGPATYKLASTISVTGAGPLTLFVCDPGVKINFTGSGDCFRFQNTTYGGNQPTGQGGGIIGRPVIDGSGATAGSVGLHAGDQTGYLFDVIVRNFTGSGAKGVWLDNHLWWTEEMRAHFSTYNCTQHVVFDVTDDGVTKTSTSSFGYNDIYAYCNCAVNQDAIVVQNGARLYNGGHRWRSNMVGSASAVTNGFLRITGTVPTGHPGAGSYSIVETLSLSVLAEITGGPFANNPQTIIFGNASNNMYGQGILRFYGGFAASNGSGAFVWNGTLLGDTVLNPSGGGLYGGIVDAEAFTTVSSGFPSGWSGSIKYTRLAESGLVMVTFALSIVATTAITAGQTIYTLPSGYYYASDTKQILLTLNNNGTYSVVPVSVSTGGVLAWRGPATTITTVTGFLYGQNVYPVSA